MNRTRPFQGRNARRRASVLPSVAVCMTVLLGFAALTIDVGYLYNTAAECQRTADAAALAGASRLGSGGAGSATQTAREFVAMNPVAHEEITDDAVVELGHWNGTSRTFHTSVGGRTIQPNAVRVVAARRDLALFMAPVMGIRETDVSREAVASGGSGRCAGIWGIEGVTTVGSIVTDSYDSTLGPYGEGNRNANGDLCSCEDVRMNGAFEVNGDVMHGAGYEFDQRGVSGQVWGIVGETSCTTFTSDADFGYAMLNHDNESIGPTSDGNDPFRPGNTWDLRIQSQDSITLNGGTYYFDSARLAGQSRIYVTAPSVIYITGDAVLTGGGIVNVTQDPANLLIYSEGSSLSLRGGAGFHGAIFAPDTDVAVQGTSDFFGMIVGRTVHIQGDGEIHVDEALVRDLLDVEPTSPALVK